MSSTPRHPGVQEVAGGVGRRSIHCKGGNGEALAGRCAAKGQAVLYLTVSSCSFPPEGCLPAQPADLASHLGPKDPGARASQGRWALGATVSSPNNAE